MITCGADSDRIWIPGAQITFRSAFEAPIKDSSKFPVIDDPKPPGVGPGALGDVLDPQLDNAYELGLAWTACENAWDKLSQDLQRPNIPGIIAVNIHNFVDTNGA